jgi:hypothetical protein
MQDASPPTILGPTTRRFANRLADFLAGVAGASHVVVVDDERTGCVGVGPAVHPEPGLLDVVLPSTATVCPLHRLPAQVRAALDRWAADAVVVVPAVFGNDLVAIGVAPVEAGLAVPLRQLDAEAQRVAAGITLARLVESARAA